ncbi:MAG: rRNA pseudouridine synthase [Myxococcales bacterium]|nr:rRNA pseudouridine synthase [Myxococcales bacterium]
MTSLRIQQILARAGVASRRRAEGLMTEGRVTVNGQRVTTLGARADPDKDVITVDGKTVGPAQPAVTLMVHKPVQVMTTLDDPEGRETVAGLVKAEPFRCLPVGRLDYHTEGLLLMTTDGELMNRLLHPRHHVPKVYQVRVRGRVGRRALDTLRGGVKLEDGMTRPTVVEVSEEGESHTWLEVVVTEGRNRLVRRMVEAVSHPAQRVIRTEMATLVLEDLKPAQYRYLQASELSALYTTVGLDIPTMAKWAEDMQGRILGQSRRGRGPLPGAASGSRPTGSARSRAAKASKGAKPK